MQQEEPDYNTNEFDEPDKGCLEREQTMQQNRLEEKKNYLKHLKHIGKEISQEIKEMNEDLDRKMQKLVEKGLNKKKQSKQPINPQIEKQLQEKYKTLDNLRLQVKRIKAKEFSMQFAVDRVKQLRGQLKIEIQQNEKLARDLAGLKRVNTATEEKQESETTAYTMEISRLKDKIKQITHQRQQQTEQLLQIGRKNKQKEHLPSLDRSRSTPKGYLVLDSPLGLEVSEAKKKYEDIGRKIEVLRIKKNMLLQEDSHIEQRKKLLESYKVKYEELKKLHDSKNKAPRKYVIKAQNKEEKREAKELIMSQHRQSINEEIPRQSSNEVDIQENLGDVEI